MNLSGRSSAVLAFPPVGGHDETLCPADHGPGLIEQRGYPVLAGNDELGRHVGALLQVVDPLLESLDHVRR